MRFHWKWFALFVLCVGIAQAQEITLQVELMKTLSTGTSRKGDQISGRVMSPAAFQGDIVEGKVTNSKAGNSVRSTSVLSFTFETLKHAGQDVPIASEVQSISNSKGQADVDEEGHVIRKTNNLGKVAGATAAGAVIGGLFGGGKGAAVGAASGAVISVVLIDISADGQNIRLEPGSKVTLTAKSRSGPALSSLSPNPTPATSSSPASVAAAAPSSTPAPAAAPAVAAPASQTGGQPSLTAVKSDFIPGDRAILYDDFTDMSGDEPPPHWKVRGGTAELRVGGGIRQLTMAGDRITMTPNLTSLPKNFTMEADVAFKGHGARLAWYFYDKKNSEAMLVKADVVYSKYDIFIRAGNETLVNQQIEMDWTKPVRQALWVQNGRVRFYVNDQRVMDVNQIELPELGKVEAHLDGPGDNDRTGYIGFQFVRFAESSPDFSQVMNSSGRYSTHGILFDTDSDRIKSESAAVIKMVAKGLESNPTLKLQIEGHTDSTGNADHNLDLSKRRAEAVKAVLVSQFNIDSSRLTTTGLGSTKPIDSNETPQGRSQNRRVEFVKQ